MIKQILQNENPIYLLNLYFLRNTGFPSFKAFPFLLLALIKKSADFLLTFEICGYNIRFRQQRGGSAHCILLRL